MVRVNFADTREFGQLPAGKYHFAVTGAETKTTSEASKYPGEDYWRLELTVQAGPNVGQHEWLSVMLPPYEASTLKTLLKATLGQHRFTEEEINEGEADVEMDDLLDLEFMGSVRPQKDNPDFNNVSRIQPVSEDAETADLLP